MATVPAAVDAAWRTALAQNDGVPLDALLAEALGTHAAAAPSCAFSHEERDRIRTLAANDIQALHADRAERRRLFLERPGWRLIIAAAGAPIFPQAFDPLNVQVLGPGEVLHTRFISLGNQLGAVEVLGLPALTEAAGAHPLFEGVRTLTLTGLAEEPEVTSAQGVVRVNADGATAELRGATVERADRTVTIHLRPPR